YRDLAQENRAAAFSGLTWIIGSVCAAFICFFLFFHYFVEHNQEAKSGMVEVMDFAVFQSPTLSDAEVGERGIGISSQLKRVAVIGFRLGQVGEGLNAEQGIGLVSIKDALSGIVKGEFAKPEIGNNVQVTGAVDMQAAFQLGHT